MLYIFQQLPPTPTPFSGSGDMPELSVPEAWLWDSAPEAVGVWNSANQSGMLTMVQFFAIAVMVVLFIGLLLMIIRKIGSDG